MIVYNCICIMCIHVCTSMYVGRSLTEPRQSSLMSTNRSDAAAAGLESSDYHHTAELEAACQPPQIPIGMSSADLFSHDVICVVFPPMCICIYIHTKTYANTWWQHSDFLSLLTLKWVAFVSSLSCHIRAFVVDLRINLYKLCSQHMCKYNPYLPLYL